MLLHLLKLVWHRKRGNILLMLEIFAAFLVVFALVVSFLYGFRHYRLPLGYEYQDVWSVEIDPGQAGYLSDWSAEDYEVVGRLVHELEGLEPVTAVAFGSNRPFSTSTTSTQWVFEGRDVESEVIAASDTFFDLLRMDLVAGRWFEPADKALDWDPVVVSQELARELYGGQDPIGRHLLGSDDKRDLRVIGVLRAFRKGGRFSAPGSLYFRRIDETGGEWGEIRFLLAKVKPGTTAELEETLSERFHAIAPQWTFTVRTLESDARENYRDMMLPTALMATIGGFLLLMVVLGLVGVMWQNVTRRTKELGVRRAVGASRRHIHRQVVMEVAIIAGFGLLLGALVVIQVPLMAPFAHLTYGIVLTGLAVSAAFMVLLAGACGLYPGWSATRIRPAEALHYE